MRLRVVTKKKFLQRVGTNTKASVPEDGFGELLWPIDLSKTLNSFCLCELCILDTESHSESLTVLAAVSAPNPILCMLQTTKHLPCRTVWLQ